MQKLSEYDQEIPQPHTADQPTAPSKILKVLSFILLVNSLPATAVCW